MSLQQQLIYLLMISLVFLLFFFLFPHSVEPFTASAAGATAIGTGIQSVLESRRKMSLNQYMIMASCDTAYDGSVVTVDQIRSVIQTGCRFFDFQVFCDENDANGFSRPYIGYSTDPTFTTIQGVDPDLR